MYDIIIIGMGISGITAAIYAKRKNQNVLLIDKSMPGGLLNNIDNITNYPGILSISGPDFAAVLLSQVQSLEIPYKLEEVTSLNLDKDIKIVKTSNNEYKASKVILALGRKPRFLGLENEQELLGRGVSTCALCDGFFYKGKDIAIVGTGNSALQEAVYLSKIVNKIYLINRRESFRGDATLVNEVKDLANVDIIYNSNVIKINKDSDKLSSITLSNNQTIPVSGLFIYIGYIPATQFLPSEILDENGYIKVSENLETPIKGVYAIGDCLNKDIYQLITAASDGAKVINNIL